MCGIVGVIGDVDPDVVRRMARILIHRGPDDQGFFDTDIFHLGFRRLSIVDVAGGAQPMQNETGTVWVVFNGEIYNYPELYKQLCSRGHEFRTRCDTEVLVHLYEELGDRMVAELNGEFAFCICDVARRRILLARDHAGIKPLFHAHLSSGGLVFASEIKAILASGLVPLQTNVQAIREFLAMNYIPHPHTIVQDICKLEPGHLLAYENGVVQITTYAAYHYPRATFSGTDKDAIEQIDTLVRDSVRRRLMSDVPLGVFLSGGVDSTGIVAMMASLGVDPLRTFSIGFQTKQYDESRFAGDVSQQFHTQHLQRIVTENDMLAEAEKIVALYDEPFGDSSAIPTYFVSQLASEHVKVVLGGDGGDEVFGGYERYRLMRLWKSLEGARALSLPIGRLLAPEGVYSNKFHNRVGRFLRGVGLPRAEQWTQLVAGARQDLARRLFKDEYLKLFTLPLNASDFFEQYIDTSAKTDENSFGYVDYRTFIPSDIAPKVDIASMANSLEVRLPLLDHRLVELGFSLPASMKVKEAQEKWIWKQVVARYVPEHWLVRPKKGFHVPIREWLRTTLREPVYQVLCDPQSKIFQYFRRDQTLRLFDLHQTERYDYSISIWLLWVLELSLRRLNLN